MKFQPGSLIRNAFKALTYSAVGALVVLFDVNRIKELQPLMKWGPAKVIVDPIIMSYF